MRIAFVSLCGFMFDLDTPLSEPLGGTESSICYLAKQLIDDGYSVDLFHDTNINEGADIVIVVNAPGEIAKLALRFPGKLFILWNQHMPDQPAVQALGDPRLWRFIDAVVFVSERQKKAYQSIIKGCRIIDEATVIGNAIAPCFENLFGNALALTAAKELKGAYTSTPFRGLRLLGQIRSLPRIDVYSSMAVYRQPDNAFLRLYGELSQNPAIKMHGSVCQPELALALKSAGFLVYPCTFTESFGIVLYEAAAAGCRIVTTRGATEDSELAAIAEGPNDFADVLKEEISRFVSADPEWQEARMDRVRKVNQTCTWPQRAREWQTLFSKLSGRMAA